MIDDTQVIYYHKPISCFLVIDTFSHLLNIAKNEHRVLVILHVMTQVGTDGRRCICRSRQACR